MRRPSRTFASLMLAAMLLAFAAGCSSSKGAHMPKHRKRRHCNCPTFSYLQQYPSQQLACAYVDGTGENSL